MRRSMYKRALFLIPAVLMALLSGCDWFDGDGDGIFDFDYVQSEQESFPEADYSKIVFYNEVGTVDVNCGEVDNIVIDYDLKCKGTSERDARNHIDNITVTITTDGSTITVHAEVDEGVDWLRAYQVDFTISMPADVELDLENVTGSVEVDDLETASVFDVTTGDLTMRNLVGNMDAVVTTGNLTISSCNGNVDVVVTTGDVELTGITGGIDGDVTTGGLNVDIDVLPSNENVTLTTTTGDITLGIAEMETTHILDLDITTGSAAVELPSDASVQFDLQVTTGSIDINGFTPTLVTDELDHKAGTIGEAENMSTLDVTVTTGNITLSAGS